MDMKEKRHRSLTRARCRKEPHYATSSIGADKCHVAQQKCYSSSETLTAYEQEARMHYGPETVEYVGQGETQHTPLSLSAFLKLLFSAVSLEIGKKMLNSCLHSD